MSSLSNNLIIMQGEAVTDNDRAKLLKDITQKNPSVERITFVFTPRYSRTNGDGSCVFLIIDEDNDDCILVKRHSFWDDEEYNEPLH
jgi:hypothetical protein